MMFHPREQTLLAVATGGVIDHADSRVMEHVTICERCHATIEGFRRMRSALLAPADGAPADLLERILQSRDAGMRVLIPAEPVSFPTVSAPSGIWRAAIAAGIAFIALATLKILARGGPEAGQRADAAVNAHVMDLGFITPAEAQSAGTPQYQPMVLEPARLHPAALRYVRRSFQNDTLTDTDTMSLTLEPTIGAPSGWRIATHRRVGDPRSGTADIDDTLWLEPVALRPVQYVYDVKFGNQEWARYRDVIGNTTVQRHAEFFYRVRSGGAGSDTYGPLHVTEDTTLPIPATRFPRVMVGGYGFVMLMAVPLYRGWTGSAFVMVPGSAQPASSMNLAVTGEQRVDYPSGTEDCWHLQRGGTSASVSYLVRKRDGVIMQQRVSGTVASRNYRMEAELLSEQ